MFRDWELATRWLSGFSRLRLAFRESLVANVVSLGRDDKHLFSKINCRSLEFLKGASSKDHVYSDAHSRTVL